MTCVELAEMLNSILEERDVSELLCLYPIRTLFYSLPSISDYKHTGTGEKYHRQDIAQAENSVIALWLLALSFFSAE